MPFLNVISTRIDSCPLLGESGHIEVAGASSKKAFAVSLVLAKARQYQADKILSTKSTNLGSIMGFADGLVSQQTCIYVVL